MNAIAYKWRAEAARHEAAAREIESSTNGTEESAIHREVAATLRKCAGDIERRPSDCNCRNLGDCDGSCHPKKWVIGKNGWDASDETDQTLEDR